MVRIGFCWATLWGWNELGLPSLWCVANEEWIGRKPPWVPYWLCAQLVIDISQTQHIVSSLWINQYIVLSSHFLLSLFWWWMLLGFSVTAKGRLNVTYRFNKNWLGWVKLALNFPCWLYSDNLCFPHLNYHILCLTNRLISILYY